MRPAVARALGLAALLGGALPAVAARAQPAAAAPAVVAPRLAGASSPEVAYPPGASGDASVTLILTLDKEGRVRSSEVEAGDEPFATAAKDTALGWRFTPATREGRPVAAKIRFAVTFHGEKKSPEPAVATAPVDSRAPVDSNLPVKPTAAPKAPPRKGPIEILVQADKLPPSVSSLSRAEVRQLPGTFGDPFRAIEILPGVTPIVSGLPFFYIRGAPPGNVGYFLDGVRVPYLFHVAIGPSIVNPAMVERVDLYSGGYPAQYGRYAGAIVSAETTQPRDDLHGEGNIRLFDAGAMVESGFDNGRGTAMIGGRYSYTGALFSVFSPTVSLDYRDYQARVTYDVTPRDRIGLFAFGAYDLLGQTENNISSTVFGSELYRFDLRYDHRLESGGHLRWAATGGFDQSRIGEEQNARDVPVGTRLELTQPLSESVTLRAGLDAQFDRYDADPIRFTDPDDPDFKASQTLFAPRSDAALAAWADVVWRLDRRVTLTPGVRFDLFRSAAASAVAPDGRLSLRADITDKVHLIHAIGVAHQTPSFVAPLPGFTPGSLQGGLQTSVQSSAGIELDLPDATTATVNVFDNVFLNMSDVLGVSRPRDAATKEPRSLGSAYGLEVYVRRRLTRRLGGFVSYTLSRSTRTFERRTFPSAFDRTHVLNAAVAFDIGRGWRAGARFTVYTGAPSLIAQATAGSDVTVTVPQRDPAFYRVDFRLEKRWTLSKTRWVSFVAEMLNATLHKEIVSGREIGPISIPSLGLEGGF